ncbi:hypothetical protein LINPERHAP2_LOCUS40350 [Linum perenne]
MALPLYYHPFFIVEGSYKLMEEVDAYYNECWWEEVFVKVLSESGKYLVYFRDIDEELEFKHVVDLISLLVADVLCCETVKVLFLTKSLCKFVVHMVF